MSLTWMYVVANKERAGEWLLNATNRLALHIGHPLQNRHRTRASNEWLHDVITNLVLDVVAGETTRAASVQTIVLVVGADVDTLERGHGGADRQQRQR